MPALSPSPKFQAVGADGLALVGGKLYSYTAGTSTPKATYTDFGLGTANTNPVILDARGEADVWLDGNYKLTLLDADDVQIWSVDDIRDLTSSATFTNSTLAGTLTVTSTAVTWSGNPTHSGNHTFTNNVTINGNTALGDSSADTLTIAPNAVTWSNNPTHSGNHIYSGNVTVNGNGAIGGDLTVTGTTTITPAGGSFTPALTFGGAATGMTFVGRSGTYQRFGGTVYFTLAFRLLAKGSSSGAAIITGLPVAASASADSSLTVTAQNMASLTGPPVAYVVAGATTISISYTSTVSTGAQTAMDDTNFTSSSIVAVSGSYKV